MDIVDAINRREPELVSALATKLKSELAKIALRPRMDGYRDGQIGGLDARHVSKKLLETLAEFADVKEPLAVRAAVFCDRIYENPEQGWVVASYGADEEIGLAQAVKHAEASRSAEIAMLRETLSEILTMLDRPKPLIHGWPFSDRFNQDRLDGLRNAIKAVDLDYVYLDLAKVLESSPVTP